MRLILAGCEYAGTTTLVNAIVKPKSTERDDYAAAERAIGAREGDGPGTIWGRGGRCLSSVAAGRLCDRLRMLVRAR